MSLDDEIKVPLYSYREFLKSSGFSQETVDAVRDKIAKHDVVPKYITNGQILSYLIHSKGNSDDCAHRMLTYYKQKNEFIEILRNRDPESNEITKCFKNMWFATFPVTPCNCNIFYMSLQNYDPKNYSFESSIKTFIMVAEAYLYRNGPRVDTILVFDMMGAKFRHSLKASMASRKKVVSFLENATPLYIKAVHFFNTAPFMAYIHALLKPFSTTGLLHRVYLHNSNINWTDFYNKHIPKSHMPKDYGGDLPSIKELHESERKILINLKEYFKLEEQQVNHELDHNSEESKTVHL